jgi:hypothetical protein
MLDMFGTGGRSLNLLAMLTPSALGFPLLFVIAAAIAAGGWPLAGERRPSPVVARIVAPLWLVPLLATYLLHALRIAALNKDRYQIAGQLGVALAVAWTVAHLASRKAQRAAVVLLAVLVPWTVATDHWPLYDGQDWRMAARASARLLSPDELVLVPSLFIEANHEASFAELERVGRWSAPQVVYPLAGKTIPLPRDLRPETRRYAERRLAELELEGRRRFSLLQIRGWPWDSWILDRYPQFALVRRHRLSQLEWYGFERRASPAVSPATTSSR